MLREKAILTHQVAARARAEGRAEEAARIEDMARLDERHVRVLRETFLEKDPSPTGQTLEVERLLDDPGGEQPASNTRPAATATATPKPKRKRRIYTVKPGDTPSGIAEATGVTLEQLEEANPDLDPQLLAPGQRIRIPQ